MRVILGMAVTSFVLLAAWLVIEVNAIGESRVIIRNVGEEPIEDLTISYPRWRTVHHWVAPGSSLTQQPVKATGSGPLHPDRPDNVHDGILVTYTHNGQTVEYWLARYILSYTWYYHCEAMINGSQIEGACVEF